MSSRLFGLALAVLLPAATLSAQSTPTPTTQPTPTAEPSAASSTSAPTDYRLSPEKREEAIAYARARYRLHFASFFWSVLVLLALIALRLGPRFRDGAESVSRRRFWQAAVFVPLLLFTQTVLELPTAAYGHRLALLYGQSVQTWGSWLWDQTKGLLVGIVIAIPLAWLLYAMLRRSPRRWWLWFWLALLPILVFLIFVAPLVIDPLFFRFEPLAPAHPELARAIERVTVRAGQPIAPEKMFVMNASSKYNTDQRLRHRPRRVQARRRVGHHDREGDDPADPLRLRPRDGPLRPVPRPEDDRVPVGAPVRRWLALGAWILDRLFRGPGRWGIRGLSDWASLPVLLLGLTIAGELATPVVSGYSRNQEHQADIFGLEAIHGLVPDSPRAAAEAFQLLGETNLSDPDPSPFITFWLYDHPPLAERLRFAAEYDPWGKGEKPKYVK